MSWPRWQLVALPAYWALLFTATHYPRVKIPGELPHGDKLLHFGAFGVLAFLFWQFASARGPLHRRFVWIAAVVLVPYAALDEWLQQFVGRFTDVMDFIANTAGIVVVLGVLEGYRRARSR
ncbi:MAG: VanZ family protein [Kofleriaceae bacterium]